MVHPDQIPFDQANDRAVNHTFTENKYDKTLVQTTSGSVLCHTSNALWVKAAGFKNSSTERKERCARLTGDTAAYAAKILNDELAGSFAAAVRRTCIGRHVHDLPRRHSHGHGRRQDGMQAMPRRAAHAVQASPNAPANRQRTTSSRTIPNPFNPETRIQFSLPKAERVDLAVYDVHGRLVRELTDFQEFAAGTYTVEWDGKDADGKTVASGVYFTRMQAGTFSTTKKMSLIK